MEAAVIRVAEYYTKRATITDKELDGVSGRSVTRGVPRISTTTASTRVGIKSSAMIGSKLSSQKTGEPPIGMSDATIGAVMEELNDLVQYGRSQFGGLSTCISYSC